MSKVKVPQFRSTRSVTVDSDATNGAVLGLNLWDETGALVDLDAMVAQAISDAGDTSGTSPSGSDLTTDDVEEGRYNEYYTDARTYAALKAQLKAGANIDLTPDDAAQTLTIAAANTARTLARSWVMA